MPADAAPKPVLRPPGLLLAMFAGASVVFTVAAVVAALGLADGATGGRIATVAGVGVVALVCLVGLASAATTRVWVDGAQLHVSALGRRTTRSLAAPATARFHYSRPTRNTIAPPWRLTLSEPGLADLSVGAYQVGAAAPLLRQVATALAANPSLPEDDLTATALRDPDGVRRPD